MSDETSIKGIIHGRMIELEQTLGLPDGQAVEVTVQAVVGGDRRQPGDGIRASAGTWADAGPELDRWLEGTQRSRRQERPGIE